MALLLFANVAIIALLQLDEYSRDKLYQTKSQVQILTEIKEQRNALSLINRSPSFGFNNIIADWVFLSFVQYFGDTVSRDRSDYQLSPQYFQAVINHDPRFVEAYSLLEPATTLFAGQPQESVNTMNYGIRYLSPEIKNAYLVWIYKAIDELLFLGDPKKSQKSYEIASEWAFKQNDSVSKQVGKRAQETAMFLSKNPDSEQAQISSWLLVLSNAKDTKTVELAISKIKLLGGEVTMDGNTIRVKVNSQ